MTINNQSSDFIPSNRQQIAYSIATFGSASLGAVVAAFAFFYYMTEVFQYTGEANEELIKSTLIGFALALGWWAEAAHIPGWQRDPRSEVAVLCDVVAEKAKEMAEKRYEFLVRYLEQVDKEIKGLV